MVSSRDIRQEGIVDSWEKSNKKAGFEAITGFGKTRVSIIAMKRHNYNSVIVIVPTTALKEQWEKELKLNKIKNSKVYVVNTAYKLNLECEFLVLDEVHTVGAAEQFAYCWKNAKYNDLMWLTATFERKDGNHKELLQVAPKVASVTFEEALLNKWVSNYTIYNIALNFTPKEQAQYNHIQKNLEELYKDVVAETGYLLSYVEKNMFSIARDFVIKYKEDTISKEKYLLGLNYTKLISQRKKLIHDAENKKKKTIWFLKESKLKRMQTIVFSQTQDFANHIFEECEEETVLIHSKMKKKDRVYSLKRFLDKRTKKRVISSVKALNEGIDIPRLEVGIMAAGTSSKKDAIQTLGRVCRLYGDKEAIFINLYIKGSQDEWWLRNRQYGLFNGKVKWIDG